MFAFARTARKAEYVGRGAVAGESLPALRPAVSQVVPMRKGPMSVNVQRFTTARSSPSGERRAVRRPSLRLLSWPAAVSGRRPRNVNPVCYLMGGPLPRRRCGSFLSSSCSGCMTGPCLYFSGHGASKPNATTSRIFSKSRWFRVITVTPCSRHDAAIRLSLRKERGTPVRLRRRFSTRRPTISPDRCHAAKLGTRRRPRRWNGRINSRSTVRRAAAFAAPAINS